MLKPSIALAALLAAGCSDPAQFRPAKGAKDYSSVKEAYRVKEADPSSCEVIGVVIEASSIDAIAVTAANNGGTHFKVTSDFDGKVLERQTVAGQSAGVVHSQSTTREVKEHHFVAEIYRCR